MTASTIDRAWREGWTSRAEDARDTGDIDYARIIHSASFRRLQGKTQILNLARKYSDQLIRPVDDATAYTEDFLTEMQNVLLGDLYGNHLDPRQLLDPRRRAIKLDQAKELEAWFRTNTAWGTEAARVEAETRERFLANQDEPNMDEPRRHVMDLDGLPLSTMGANQTQSSGTTEVEHCERY